MQDLVKQVEPLVRSAGQAIMGYFRHDFQQREKSLGDFVTEADLVSQKILIAGLTKLLSQAQIIAEELDNSQILQIDHPAEYCWVIDPLDGTNNFRRGIPHFAISIALTKHQKTVLGIIYDPVHQDLFYAIAGQGVYYNHQQLIFKLDAINNLGTNGSFDNSGVLAKHDQEKLVLDSNQASDSNNRENLKIFHNSLITTNIREIALLNLELEGAILRKFGSAALDLAYAAMGWIDLVAYQGLYIWDFAAGELLVLEAQKQIYQVHLPGSWGGQQLILAGLEPLVTQMRRYIN